MNTGAYLLGAYSLEEVMNRNVQQAAVSSSAGAAAVPKQDALRAEEWMTTAYTEYALYDLDQDTRTEIAVIQVDPAGTNSTVQIYGWRDGTFMIRDTVSLSAGIVSNGIRNVATNLLRGEENVPVRALYISMRTGYWSCPAPSSCPAAVTPPPRISGSSTGASTPAGGQRSMCAPPTTILPTAGT